MSVTHSGLRIGASGRQRLGAASVVLPAVIVAGVLGLLIATLIATYHGNLTGFVHFGAGFAHATHPPAGWISGGAQGYDGQFFYVLAHDPLLLHDSTLHQMQATGQVFRIQRLGYPLLVFALSAGRPNAIPAALLAVNAIVLVSVTAWFAAYARRRGWPTLWALAIGLAPGMLLPMLRDLSDPLATACVLVGVLMWQARRRAPAVLALTAAVLTREVTIALIVGLAAEVGVRIWRTRTTPGAWRPILAEAWPVLGIPTLVFLLWHTYITVRAGSMLGSSDVTLPFVNMVQEVVRSLRTGPITIALWDTAYVALMFAGVLLAARSLRHRVTVLSVSACALCASVVLPVFGDFWSDTRLSAPLFAILLVDGLQRRDRACVAVGTAASAMTALFLLGI